MFRNTLLTTAFCLAILFIPGLFSQTCHSIIAQTRSKSMMNKSFEKGTFGFDVQFFNNQKVEIIELIDEHSGARILVVPTYQGRVMTSSARGHAGNSLGWINYNYIEAGEINNQFNPFGGEERFWLGPEGGPFSIYFNKGHEQSFTNWRVPNVIDYLAFETIDKSSTHCSFQKEFELINASGNKLDIGVKRTIRLLPKNEVEDALNASIEDSLHLVAYETENVLVNRGNSAWTEDRGFLSIWLLCMFNSSDKGIVFMPFNEGSEEELGKVVEDNYFGKVPSDRLLVKDGTIFFRVDGKYRSKIGLSPERAKSICGSYDPLNKVLTILSYSKPEKPQKYVNSKWGEQDNPLKGDALNAYNDGPLDDGSIMGPFYEIESSSPAALLQPGESINHTQRIFHITGDEKLLDEIMKEVFQISIEELSSIY